MANVSKEDEYEEYNYNVDENINQDVVNEKETAFYKRIKKMRMDRELKMKKLEEEKKKEEERKGKVIPEELTPPGIDSGITKFMNLIQANITRIHFRFEDDFFSVEIQTATEIRENFQGGGGNFQQNCSHR